jgi:peptidoglycan/LPS O-acetylase OafA/YrhL
MLAYLGFALWVRYGRRLRLDWLVLAAALFMLPFSFRGVDGLDAGFEWGWLHCGVALDRLLFSFGLGVLLSRVDASRIPQVRPWMLLALLALALDQDPGPAWGPYYELFMVWFCLPGLVFLGLASEPQSSLGQSFFGTLGRLSYGLYMLHYPLLMWTAELLWRFKISWRSGYSVPLLLFMLLCALYFERHYERPFRESLGRKLALLAGPKPPAL